MIRIIDHLKEKEAVLQLNLQRVQAALRRGEAVTIYHPVGHIHGRLANIPGVEYVESRGLGSGASGDDMALLGRLTTLNGYRMPYYGEPRGELYIHWFYRERSEDRLGKCEMFHLNMLRYFNVMDRVDVIHIRCAWDGRMTHAMESAIAILECGHATVDFRIVKQKKNWEHDTIKEAAEYAVATGKFVYYTHFKGVTHVEDPNLIGGYRNGSRKDPNRRIYPLDILYWSYIMYRYIFVDAPTDAKAIGPLLHPNNATLHYSTNPGLTPGWAYHVRIHYTGSFQAFDGAFLKRRFAEFGASRTERDKALWVNDPYTVEQFLALCFRPEEVATLGKVDCPYMLHTQGKFPDYMAGFDNLTLHSCNNICVANGTYKYIGGTDTFNWAMCSAFKKLGYNVYYYAPDMDGNGVTEKYLQEIGVSPYKEGIPLAACFANQQSGKHFIGKCPVVQTCHSKWTALEWPVKGAEAYVVISEEIQDHLKTYGFNPVLMRNGEDLERYAPVKPLHQIPRVLSICQGDDSLLKEACLMLGWEFRSVPKEVKKRVWHVEDMINDADIVVGIGRSLYDGMACGRACISWDNRKLDPYSGCGYITAANWHICAKTNFTGRGFPKINTVGALICELKKYRAADGAVMRSFAAQELNAAANALKYLELAGIRR